MYDDWQIINVNQLFEDHRWSVVHKLPSINGQNIVNEVVKPLALSLNNNVNVNSSGNLNSTFINNNQPQQQQSTNQEIENDTIVNKDEFYLQNSNNTISNELNDYTYYLKTDRDVHWVMEVICYGLSLPLSTTEHYETVRDCVQIYCEWMHSLTPNKSNKLIPFPIRDDPNHYFRRILQHLYNIFVPRISSIYTLHNISNSTELSMTDIISKQALLCHRVLRTISMIAEDESNLIGKCFKIKFWITQLIKIFIHFLQTQRLGIIYYCYCLQPMMYYLHNLANAKILVHIFVNVL